MGVKVLNISLTELQELMKLPTGEQRTPRVLGIEEIKVLESRLNTSLKEGLKSDNEDIQKRKEMFGCNVVASHAETTFLQLFKNSVKAFQPKSFRNILIFAGVLLLLFLAVSYLVDLTSILSYLFLKGSFDCFVLPFCYLLYEAYFNKNLEKEFYAEKVRKDSEGFSVLRDGEIKNVYISDIIVGDICQVKPKDIVPADGIFFHIDEGDQIVTREWILTGDNSEVVKSFDNDLNCYAGSIVVKGTGSMVVTAVGSNTQMNQDISPQGIDSPVVLLELSPLWKVALTISVCITIYNLFKLFLSLYIINQEAWDIMHLQFIITKMALGIIYFIRLIPLTAPLAILLSFRRACKESFKANVICRNINPLKQIGILNPQENSIDATQLTFLKQNFILPKNDLKSFLYTLNVSKHALKNVSRFVQFAFTVNLVLVLNYEIGVLPAVQFNCITLAAFTLAFVLVPSDCQWEKDARPLGDSLLTKQFWINVIGNGIYYMIIRIILVFVPLFHDIDSFQTGSDDPTPIGTMIYNTLFLCVLFHALCTRIRSEEMNIFRGIGKHPLFCVLWILLLFLQCAIVQFGGLASSTYPLTPASWLWCLFLAFGILIWAQLVAWIGFKFEIKNSPKPSAELRSNQNENERTTTAV